MEQTIKFCRTEDGVRIAYATLGQGPPLVWVASWLTHLDLDLNNPLLSHWFRALSQQHTLIRFDARGNGLSDRDVHDLGVKAWARDLKTVVDDLGLDNFNLLGFCQGGAAAVHYTATHPERVDRLVLYDSFARGAFTPDSSAKEQRQAEALAEMIAVGWGRETAAFRKVFTDLLIPEASPREISWLTELQRATVSPRMAVNLWRAFHTIDIRKTARRLTVPVVIFHVRGDQMVPFEAGRELAALIPDAQFVPLQGHNHILLEEDPSWKRFLSELNSFLGNRGPRWTEEELEKAVSLLTPREIEVLQLVGEGLSNHKIAEILVIAPKTARNHVSRIYGKLSVDSRAQAVLFAQQANLVRSRSKLS